MLDLTRRKRLELLNFVYYQLPKLFQAIVVSLPTIESAYAIHTTKGIQGFQHPDIPALKLAVEVLDATESYLWVCPSLSFIYESCLKTL